MAKVTLSVTPSLWPCFSRPRRSPRVHSQPHTDPLPCQAVCPGKHFGPFPWETGAVEDGINCVILRGIPRGRILTWNWTFFHFFSMPETFLSLPQCSSRCSRRCMVPCGLHHHDTYGLSYTHRRVILVRDRRHPSWALLPWITTLMCLSFVPPSLEVSCWLLPADTIGPSVIFINVKYVLLCLQLWKFKWNLNCKKKSHFSSIYIT